MSKKMLKCFAVVLTFALILSIPVTAFAATSNVTKIVKGTKVILTLPAVTPSVGDNKITISLTDKKTQKVITGSTVKVEAEMDVNSMDSMNMSKTKKVTLKEGKTKGAYAGTVKLSDAGKWKLKLFYTTGSGKNMKTNTTTFVINVK